MIKSLYIIKNFKNVVFYILKYKKTLPNKALNTNSNINL